MTDPATAQLRVHSITHGSRANGPGVASILHLQGCSIRCPGCFNQQTWDHSRGNLRSVQNVLDELDSAPHDLIAISGGEPLDQA